MVGIVNRFLKLSKPTHGEPKKPFVGLNFWNAITVPTMEP